MTEIEYVDILDENDNIVSTVCKQEAHEKGLLHRTAIAEVINSKGQWILVKQAGDRQDAGQYVSPVGGHVKSGENLLDALKREAKEEMGLENFTYKYIGKKIYNREVLGRKENHYFILYEIYSDEEPTLNNESVSFERFTTQRLKEELKNNPKKFGNAYHFVVEIFYPQLTSVI